MAIIDYLIDTKNPRQEAGTIIGEKLRKMQVAPNILEGKIFIEAFRLVKENMYYNPLKKDDKFFKILNVVDNPLLTEEEILDSYCTYYNSILGSIGALESAIKKLLVKTFNVLIEQETTYTCHDGVGQTSSIGWMRYYNE